MANIPFTSNYTDLSSSRGFQFKFHCQKCGNGYESTFKTNTLGAVAGAANAAASLLGGIFGRAAAGAQELESMVAGPQHDAALRDAVEEIRPLFKQCTRCGQWVCEPVCWNKKAGLCENCAPDLDEEIASAQAQAAKSQATEKAAQVDYLADRHVDQVQAVTCPACGKWRRAESSAVSAAPRSPRRNTARPAATMPRARRSSARSAASPTRTSAAASVSPSHPVEARISAQRCKDRIGSQQPRRDERRNGQQVGQVIECLVDAAAADLDLDQVL